MSSRSSCSCRSHLVPMIEAENQRPALFPPPPRPPLNQADNSEIPNSGKGPAPGDEWLIGHQSVPLHRQGRPGFTARFRVAFYIKSVPPMGPVAQGIEQQPSKLKVAGSNPAGVTNKFKYLFDVFAIAASQKS
jgi:hypothetical protein